MVASWSRLASSAQVHPHQLGQTGAYPLTVEMNALLVYEHLQLHDFGGLHLESTLQIFSRVVDLLDVRL